MATSLQMLRIEPKIVGGKTVIPAFELANQIEFPQQNGCYLTTVEHQARGVPTLGQLRHAFDTSQPFKQAVYAQRSCGEWTSTAWEDGKYVHEVARLVSDGDTWEVEGGVRTKVRMPEDGWGLDYHPTLGVPTKTGDREDAVARFGQDASYFLGDKEGFRPVLRGLSLDVGGPFYVDAHCGPDGRYSDVGGRACRRSEHLGTRGSEYSGQESGKVAAQPATSRNEVSRLGTDVPRPRVLDEEAVAELKRYRSQIDEGLRGIDDILSRLE
ncbi:MAG: hypothetical protein HYS81_03865 [Candidatus Aenigmatarchaeota archaeon]|nr:MAG: hypothetical protein HYS81_03865 [Candidatus Aenigmarchaeota archaeon]